MHLALPAGGEVPRPGDLVSVDVTYAAPYHLVADSALAPGGRFAVRRTRAGDAWDRRQSCDDEHSHGGAARRLRDRRPGGPRRARPADDRPTQLAGTLDR